MPHRPSSHPWRPLDPHLTGNCSRQQGLPRAAWASFDDGTATSWKTTAAFFCANPPQPSTRPETSLECYQPQTYATRIDQARRQTKSPRPRLGELLAFASEPADQTSPGSPTYVLFLLLQVLLLVVVFGHRTQVQLNRPPEPRSNQNPKPLNPQS